jgi:hypothetical protein
MGTAAIEAMSVTVELYHSEEEDGGYFVAVELLRLSLLVLGVNLGTRFRKLLVGDGREYQSIDMN